MKKMVSSQWSVVGRKGKFLIFCFLFSAFCLSSCSIPVLEDQECIDARQTVKDLYSYHFGNYMKFTPENLKQRERFLTPELFNNLQTAPPESDPFTLTNDTPKSFRVGSCQVVEPGKKVNLQVSLFWKTETRSEQREINVEVVKQNDKWLVNRIFNK